MKIPTPNLIDALRIPIPHTWWDGKVSADDAAKAEELMLEAALQLEWFLNKEKREK